MQIRIRSTGQVLLQHEWEKWVAQTYAKSLSGISEEAVNRFESDIVFEGPQATGGTVYQYSQQDGVEQIDGKWYTKYILGPVFTDTPATDFQPAKTAAENEADYRAMKDAEQAANVRRQRTEMLKDCDWVVTKAIVVYYGNAVYSTESEAIANLNIETFSEAPNTAANAIYLGAIIIKGDGTFAVAADFTIIPGGLFRGVGGGGGGGGTTTPGGSNTQIQYNNNGVFGGVPNLTWNGTTLSATGSFTGSFTGSLLGTASYATTASYALNGGVTQLLAGSNISLSPTNGLGQVTISSTGGGGGGFNTATGFGYV